MSGAAARTRFLINIKNRKYIKYKKELVVNTRKDIGKRGKRKV